MSPKKNLSELVEKLLKGDRLKSDDWRILPVSAEIVQLKGPSGTLSVFDGSPHKLLFKKEYEVGQLIEIGRSLSATRDLDTLLGVAGPVGMWDPVCGGIAGPADCERHHGCAGAVDAVAGGEDPLWCYNDS